MKNTAYYSNQAQKQQVMFHEWQDEDKKMDLLDTLTCIGCAAGFFGVLAAMFYGLI